MSIEELSVREKLDLYYHICDQQSKKSVGCFLDRTVINSYPQPRPFGEIAETWQREIVRPKIAALEGMVGLRDYTGPRSFLTVLPRGHDKSSLEARMLSWALCYSPRRIEAALCATDRDQAALVTRAMQDEANLNPWYGPKLDFQRNKVVGPCGIVDILPADAAGAYGGRYNLIIADELGWWRNDQMWTAIASGREKVPGSILVVVSNAGVIDSWQDRLVHQVAIKDPNEWVLFERQGKLASWMTDERWAKSRALLPPIMARRVLDNEWVSSSEDSGYLSYAEVQACLNDNLRPIPPGAQCVASIDYGAVNDRTAMTIVYQDENGIIQVPILECIQGHPGHPVQLADVEAWIESTYKTYRWKVCYVDPHQTEGTIQKFQKLGYPIERVDFRGGAFNCDIATNLRTLIINRKISWHPAIGKDFASELIGLVTKITPHGYRFENASGKHDDQAFAVSVAAIEAVKRPYIQPITYVPKIDLDVGNPMDLFGKGIPRSPWALA